MSVVNVAYRPDAVWFLTDTMVYEDGAPAGLTDTKAHIADGGRFAFTTRGNVMLGDALDDLLAEQPSVDEAVEVAVAFFETLPDVVREKLLGYSFDATIGGWSARHDDLRVAFLYLRPGHPVETRWLPHGVHLYPAPANAPALPAIVTEAQMIKLALVQHRIQERLDDLGIGRMCIGGVMHLTTVDHHGASQRLIATYPDYDRHAEDLGDPNADDVAAFRQMSERTAA